MLNNNKDFIELAENELERLSDLIEDNDPDSSLDVEYSDGILNISILSNNSVYVVNKHSASKKIWFSSPISGTDYFFYKNNLWVNDSKQELSFKLINELTTHFQFKYTIKQ